MRVEKSPDKNDSGISKALRKGKIMVKIRDNIITLIF